VPAVAQASCGMTAAVVAAFRDVPHIPQLGKDGHEAREQPSSTAATHDAKAIPPASGRPGQERHPPRLRRYAKLSDACADLVAAPGRRAAAGCLPMPSEVI